jgi:hypothetical protein
VTSHLKTLLPIFYTALIAVAFVCTGKSRPIGTFHASLDFKSQKLRPANALFREKTLIVYNLYPTCFGPAWTVSKELQVMGMLYCIRVMKQTTGLVHICIVN